MGWRGNGSEWHWQLSASTRDQRRRYALVSSRPGAVATWPFHFNFMEEAVQHAMPSSLRTPYAVVFFLFLFFSIFFLLMATNIWFTHFIPFYSPTPRTGIKSHDSTMIIVPLAAEVSSSPGYLPNGQSLRAGPGTPQELTDLSDRPAAIPVRVCHAVVQIQGPRFNLTLFRISCACNSGSSEDPLM